MKGKQRLSASVDGDLLQAAQAAVAAGRVESMSAWVNDALRLKADYEQRMNALDHFIAEFEAEHGEITGDEIGAATRRARSRATVVRSTSPSGGTPGAGVA